jgi:hypothetical protein
MDDENTATEAPLRTIDELAEEVRRDLQAAIFGEAGFESALERAQAIRELTVAYRVLVNLNPVPTAPPDVPLTSADVDRLARAVWKDLNENAGAHRMGFSTDALDVVAESIRRIGGIG